MFPCFFVSDLHGRPDRYESLFARIAERRPRAVLLGGDLLPHGMSRLGAGKGIRDFIPDFLRERFGALRDELGDDYPSVLLIMGNDDPRCELEALRAAGAGGLWEEIHGRGVAVGGRRIFGYSCVPPTPFRLKDWELYDVSRYVDPGCVSPEEGFRTVEADPRRIRWTTIAAELEVLAGEGDLSDAVFLFHTPPHDTALDRAALDGKKIDHAPLDPHVGSIAVRRFIERRRPALTLHGHIHESPRISGAWRDELAGVPMFSAAHDGPELALVVFDLHDPGGAERELVRPDAAGLA